jgi:hypothetical protein
VANRDLVPHQEIGDAPTDPVVGGKGCCQQESRGANEGAPSAISRGVLRTQARLSLLIPIRPASSRAADRYQVRDGRVQRDPSSIGGIFL